MSWGIAYKEDPKRPVTKGGRTLAFYQDFETKEDAEKTIAAFFKDPSDVYAVEWDGKVKPEFLTETT